MRSSVYSYVYVYNDVKQYRCVIGLDGNEATHVYHVLLACDESGILVGSPPMGTHMVNCCFLHVALMVLLVAKQEATQHTATHARTQSCIS